MLDAGGAGFGQRLLGGHGGLIYGSAGESGGGRDSCHTTKELPSLDGHTLCSSSGLRGTESQEAIGYLWN